MASIHVEIGGRTTTYDEPRVLRIGREPDSDVLAEGPTVSRRHAELRPSGEGWEVVDVGSTHGTWVDGRRVGRQPLAGSSIVRFGLPEGGVTAHVTVTGAVAADRPLVAAGVAAAPPAALAATVLPYAPTPGTGPGLLVRSRAGDLRFGDRAPVRIGREPGLEVVVDDPGVSREHALVEPRPDGWWYLDRSHSGSYVDGERIVQHRLEGPVTVLLGHPTAGYELELVPVVEAGRATAVIHRRKRRRTLALVAAAVALVVLVGGSVAAVLLLGEDDPAPPDETATGLTEAELDRAKQASVQLQWPEGGSGSGSIISEDGLILTNAHVAQPSAQMDGALPEDDPAYLLVALPGADDDTPVAPAYRAEPIVTDGYLDLSVVKITADAEGNPVAPEDLDLPTPIPLGDSDELRTGDTITALGYPGIATIDAKTEGQPLTVTRGVVSTFRGDDVVGDPRAEIDSDIRIGSGNSGGASINDDGEIIGVNSAVFSYADEDDAAASGGTALIRSINTAEEILAIAEQGGDPEYVSPYFDQVPPTPTPTTPEGGGDATVLSAGWTLDGGGGCAGSSSLDQPQTLSGVVAPVTIYAEFAVVGLPDGAPIEIRFVDEAGNPHGAISQPWELGPEACAAAPFDVPAGLAGVAAEFWVGDQLVATNPVYLEP